jgi:hypothetical protein
MRALVDNGGDLARATSLLLGLLAILAAAAAMLSPMGPSALAGWALEVLGAGFLTVLGLLELAALFAVVKMLSVPRPHVDFWQSVALQAAGAVTSLALTFTLLGISLGIGSLAGQPLTPDTVQDVIQELTANFSLAFMTTVVGLPSATLLRAVAVIAGNRRRLLDDLTHSPLNQEMTS